MIKAHFHSGNIRVIIFHKFGQFIPAREHLFKVLRVRCSICFRCSILILLIKTVVTFVRCSIPHYIYLSAVIGAFIDLCNIMPFLDHLLHCFVSSQIITYAIIRFYMPGQLTSSYGSEVAYSTESVRSHVTPLVACLGNVTRQLKNLKWQYATLFAK
jgi:hypothetical protein